MENSEVAEPRSLIKIPQSLIKMPKKPRVFISEFLVLGIVQNAKLEVEKPRKYILRLFRELQVLDLTGHFGYDFPLRLARCMSDTQLNIFRFFGVSENETNL